jgi:hypothetical protein
MCNHLPLLRMLKLDISSLHSFTKCLFSTYWIQADRRFAIRKLKSCRGDKQVWWWQVWWRTRDFPDCLGKVQCCSSFHPMALL